MNGRKITVNYATKPANGPGGGDRGGRGRGGFRGGLNCFALYCTPPPVKNRTKLDVLKLCF